MQKEASIGGVVNKLSRVIGDVFNIKRAFGRVDVLHQVGKTVSTKSDLGFSDRYELIDVPVRDDLIGARCQS